MNACGINKQLSTIANECGINTHCKYCRLADICEKTFWTEPFRTENWKRRVFEIVHSFIIKT